MLTSIYTDEPLLSNKKIYVSLRPIEKIQKRSFDLVIALFVTLFILSWMIPLVGVIIISTSPGPIFFVQWRTGLNGAPFQCLKFRTMHHSCSRLPFKQASYNDARITALGRWLRRTNLDEMPQFLNVLMGTMSVVGPRPHAIQHDAKFWFVLPDYPKRYAVRPGITGLAQAHGARGFINNTRGMQHRLRYDFFYIKNYTFWLDLRICWKTAEAMFTGNTNAW